MSNSQQNEQEELDRYLEEKAKQKKDEEQKQKSESLSEYEACVLRESARVRELVAEARNGLNNK